MPKITTSVALALSITLLMPAPKIQAQSRQAGAAGVLAMPANYREYIAAYLANDDRYVVRDAKITKPYEKSGGLFRGGKFAAVCVAVFRDNPLGFLVRDNWTFENDGGRIKPVQLGMDSCEPLTPFPELMKALASRRSGGTTR